MSTPTENSAHTPAWTYSIYRASLRYNGVTVALLTPDGRNAFTINQVACLLTTLNSLPFEQSSNVATSLAEGRA